ncbi:hypothetical protein Scep_020472 [Stephania cephalantha]|uniref:TF-B3 domain-containing protein n=1 Tax=Stephania cephalantha TaxID=152367 RepID=A0AAP0ID86_9MAGN
MTRGKAAIANPVDEQSRDLRFFKVMFGDFRRRMRIPRVFIRHLLEESPNEVNLEGPSGNIWRVKLKITKNDIFFGQGWEAFQVDHSLAMGEALLFEYDGKKHLKVSFIVSMYGLTREDVFTVECSQESSSTFRGNERQVSNITNAGDPQLDCTDEHNLSTPSTDQINPLSDQVVENKLASPNADRLIVDQDKPGSPEAAANSFTSSSPFFTVQIKSYNVREPYHLQVPTPFAIEHLNSRSKRMVLRNLEGSRWSVKILHRLKTMKLLSGGFRNFSRDNSLEVGDFCVFELMNNETEMKVHIFR